MPDQGRSRRARWPLAVIGVTLLALLCGALGVFIGRATAPGPAIVVAPGPVVQQSPDASSLPVSTGNGRPAIVVSDSAPSVPTVFTPATDLPDTPTVATGYQVTVGQVDGAALTSALADAFGVDGEVAQTTDGWIIGRVDGSAPSVTVTDDPLMSWSFEDPDVLKGTAGAAIDPETAREQAATVLTAVGVDIGTVDWQVDRFADQTRVTAWQLLEGSRTDLAWEVSFGKGGAVASATGFAAGLVEVPGYPVVGAATAVRRSAVPTWAALGPVPVPTSASGAAASDAAVPQVPAPTGSAVPERPSLTVPIARVDVVEADLGLGQYRQPDGAVLILPSYRLRGSDGSRWSVLALTTADVRFAPVPYPSASPTGG